MHPRLCRHEHFDIISNPFKYKCETYPKFYTFILKNYDGRKM